MSADPIWEEYLGTSPKDLTNGGMFNTKNMNVYNYTAQNPINLVDPDGNALQKTAIEYLAKGLGLAVTAYKAHKAKKAAQKLRAVEYNLQIAKSSSKLLYLDRPPEKRPDGNVFSALAEETATGKPVNYKEGQTLFHRNKAVDISNEFIKQKNKIAQDKILQKKQKKKLFGVIDLQLKPLKKAIDLFDKNKDIPASQKTHKLRKDKAKVK